MTIGSVGSAISASLQQARGERFAKLKKAFDELGSALKSGSLTDAKDVLAQLEENLPAQANNPISDKLSALGKAIDSGDLSGAQQDFADIKTTLSRHRPGAGAPPGGAPPADGPHRGSHRGAKQDSDAGNSSGSNSTYDPKDTNKDGKVSLQELLAYVLKSAGNASQSSTDPSTTAESGTIDTFA